MGNLYCGLCKASSGRGGILWPHDGTHGDSFFLSFFLSFFFGARARGSHACCLRSFVPLPSFSPCFAFLRRVFLFPSNVISNNTNYLGFVGFVVASFSFSFFSRELFSKFKPILSFSDPWKENLVHVESRYTRYERERERVGRIDTLRYLACLVSERSSLSIDNSDANVIDRPG